MLRPLHSNKQSRVQMASGASDKSFRYHKISQSVISESKPYIIVEDAGGTIESQPQIPRQSMLSRFDLDLLSRRGARVRLHLPDDLLIEGYKL